MKKFKKVLLLSLAALVVTGGVFAVLLQPVFALGPHPVYAGNNQFDWQKPQYDSTKKTVFIIADKRNRRYRQCAGTGYAHRGVCAAA